MSDAIRAQTIEAGITLDDQQLRLLDALLELTPASPRTENSHGIYVHGPVGRGKSWITTAWYLAITNIAKQRIHFHEFLDQINREVFVQRQKPSDGIGLMDRVFYTLLGNVELLLFDEFHVHDPGDGRMLSALLDYVEKHEITLVITSNYAPQDLMPSPAWHPLFVPTIEQILRNLRVIPLNGPIDYREKSKVHRQGFASGGWVDRAELHDDHAHKHGVLDPVSIVRVREREFQITSVVDTHLTATFAQLCESAISTIEYLDWARRFATWTITAVPAAGEIAPQAQQRMLNLVDIAADAGIAVNFVAHQSLEMFIAQLRETSDTSRLISRLSLLSPDARS